MRHRIVLIVPLALVCVLVGADVALADAVQVGEGIKEQLGGLASAAFVGIVAVVSLVFLMNRRLTELAVFLVAACVVGAFVLAPDSTTAMLQSVAESVTGGGAGGSSAGATP